VTQERPPGAWKRFIASSDEEKLVRLAGVGAIHLACLALGLVFVAFAAAGLPSSKVAAKCSTRSAHSQERARQTISGGAAGRECFFLTRRGGKRGPALVLIDSAGPVVKADQTE
jgi:hypothetical protein